MFAASCSAADAIESMLPGRNRRCGATCVATFWFEPPACRDPCPFGRIDDPTIKHRPRNSKTEFRGRDAKAQARSAIFPTHRHQRHVCGPPFHPQPGGRTGVAGRRGPQRQRPIRCLAGANISVPGRATASANALAFLPSGWSVRRCGAENDHRTAGLLHRRNRRFRRPGDLECEGSLDRRPSRAIFRPSRGFEQDARRDECSRLSHRCRRVLPASTASWMRPILIFVEVERGAR